MLPAAAELSASSRESDFYSAIDTKCFWHKEKDCEAVLFLIVRLSFSVTHDISAIPDGFYDLEAEPLIKCDRALVSNENVEHHG